MASRWLLPCVGCRPVGPEREPEHHSVQHLLQAFCSARQLRYLRQRALTKGILRPGGGLKRSGSSLGQHRRASAGKYAAGSGSRSHTPSGSMTERRTAAAGSFGGPDGAALRSSLAAAGVDGSPKKRPLRRVCRSACRLCRRLQGMLRRRWIEPSPLESQTMQTYMCAASC